jgi:methionine synthase I (cobalamin-dependent)
MSYDKQQQTLAGQRVEEVTTHLVALGVEVIGANCSAGPAEMVKTLRRMRAVAPTARISVAPNAGVPLIGEDEAMRYPVGPEEFAMYTAHYVELGASMVGGCCGTTPAYTAAMRRAMDVAAV